MLIILFTCVMSVCNVRGRNGKRMDDSYVCVCVCVKRVYLKGTSTINIRTKKLFSSIICTFSALPTTISFNSLLFGYSNVMLLLHLLAHFNTDIAVVCIPLEGRGDMKIKTEKVVEYHWSLVPNCFNCYRVILYTWKLQYRLTSIRARLQFSFVIWFCCISCLFVLVAMATVKGGNGNIFINFYWYMLIKLVILFY